ncbi:SCP2 sterol-binding domain-containing protein [Comamonas flocculans]|uniref:SCP2 domain-containing protein n=1 Tax=Comamonas flocculans TaxID=2597701 RepID=A0A5B8RY54_9BURK|nr:hypothetical protein [Comamonas flocculans]QEA14063.1 hypothetical protein FOZ74_14090 [Comamonas flocculans]
MNTRSPFSFLHRLAAQMPRPPRAPQWLVKGTQQRLVLLLNHVLQQEPVAMQRLQRQSGRVARVQWRSLYMALQVTPAGLLDLAPEGAHADLQVWLTQESPLELARGALAGERPEIRIEGDVQLAADIQWLAQNLRWDIEDDLARLLGDTTAHLLAGAAQRVLAALRGFVARARPHAGAGADASAGT